MPAQDTPCQEEDIHPGLAFRAADGNIWRVIARDGNRVAFEIPCSRPGPNPEGISRRGLDVFTATMEVFLEAIREPAPAFDMPLPVPPESMTGEAALSRLLDAIETGRQLFMSGQNTGAMTAARDDIARLRRALWTLWEGLPEGCQIVRRDPDGNFGRAMDARDFIDIVLSVEGS